MKSDDVGKMLAAKARAAKVDNLNGALARLPALEERVRLAEVALQAATNEDSAARSVYRAHRETLLDLTLTAVERTKILDELEAVIADYDRIAAALQRARAERGTAYAELDRAIAARGEAYLALERAIAPEVAS